MAKRPRARTSVRNMSLRSRTRHAVRGAKAHALTKARAAKQAVSVNS